MNNKPYKELVTRQVSEWVYYDSRGLVADVRKANEWVLDVSETVELTDDEIEEYL